MRLSGEKINDLLDGFVGAVVGGFELAAWLVVDVWLVMEAAVGEGAAEAFVEEEKEEGNLGALRSETIGVA